MSDKSTEAGWNVGECDLNLVEANMFLCRSPTYAMALYIAASNEPILQTINTYIYM